MMKTKKTKMPSPGAVALHSESEPCEHPWHRLQIWEDDKQAAPADSPLGSTARTRTVVCGDCGQQWIDPTAISYMLFRAAMERMNEITADRQAIHTALRLLGLDQCDRCGNYLKRDDERNAVTIPFGDGDILLCASCPRKWIEWADGQGDQIDGDEWLSIRDTIRRWIDGPGYGADHPNEDDRKFLKAFVA